MASEKYLLNNGRSLTEFHGVTLDRINNVLPYACPSDKQSMRNLAIRFLDGRPIPYQIYIEASEALERTENSISEDITQNDKKPKIQNLLTKILFAFAVFLTFITI